MNLNVIKPQKHSVPAGSEKDILDCSPSRLETLAEEITLEGRAERLDIEQSRVEGGDESFTIPKGARITVLGTRARLMDGQPINDNDRVSIQISNHGEPHHYMEVSAKNLRGKKIKTEKL